MEEKDFYDKYWQSNTKIVTVVNPRAEDYVFQATIETGVDTATGRTKSEARTYRVPAGGSERFPGPIANMYLDQMTKLIAQDDEKIQFLIDFALRAQYYDQLIVSIEDLTNTFQPYPEYLDKPEDKAAEKPADQPFAAAKAEAEPEPARRGRPPKAVTEA